MNAPIYSYVTSIKIHARIWRFVFPLIAIELTAAVAQGRTLTSIGPTAPGVIDTSQLSSSGTALPDGLNYLTDNNPVAGKTFTMEAGAKRLVVTR